LLIDLESEVIRASLDIPFQSDAGIDFVLVWESEIRTALLVSKDFACSFLIFKSNQGQRRSTPTNRKRIRVHLDHT
jgi:hypothetical protein